MLLLVGTLFMYWFTGKILKRMRCHEMQIQFNDLIIKRRKKVLYACV